MVLNPAPGWGLRPVEITDQAVFAPYLQSLSEPLSDYTFSQIFTWRNSLRLLWRRLEDQLCVFANGTDDLTLLLPPIGLDPTGPGGKALSAAFELMDDYNAQHQACGRSRVEYASAELLRRFDTSGLDIEPMGHDYVYDVRRMIDLAGPHLASKRQSRSRFLRLYRYRTERYDAVRHLPGCLDLLGRWKLRQDEHHPRDEGLVALKRQKESLATELALQWARPLGLTGLVVHVADPQTGAESLAGFTLGERLGPDQASIVVEKTDLSIKGLAQFIFSEFCATCWSDRAWINAGDDWGIESLGWTKQSYRPAKLLGKYVLRRTARAQVLVRPAVSYVIRPAQPEDVPPAAALEVACFDVYRLSIRRLNYLLRSKRAIVRVARSVEGGLLGSAVALVYRHHSVAVGHLYNLAVDPAARGRGIGDALLRSLLDELGNRQVERVLLEVEQSNTAARRLYERHAFHPVARLADYYGPGRDALRMSCELAPVKLRPAA